MSDVKVRLTRGPAPKDDQCVVVRAYIGRKRVGNLGACLGAYREKLYVLQAHVDESARRSGIGTKMYEEMAREACARGTALVSQEFQQASVMSQTFWAKQLAKGRAAFHPSKGEYVIDAPCAVTTLAGARKRRKR